MSACGEEGRHDRGARLAQYRVIADVEGDPAAQADPGQRLAAAGQFAGQRFGRPRQGSGRGQRRDGRRGEQAAQQPAAGQGRKRLGHDALLAMLSTV